MVPSGPPTPIGGAQTVSPTLLRSNSAILGSQGGQFPPQANFSSLGSPRTQYNINLLGNTSTISTLLNQSYGNGSLNTGLSGLGGFQRGGVDTRAESDPLSTDIDFAPSSSSFAPSNLANFGSSGQVQSPKIMNASGNQLLLDQQHSQVQQHELQKFQHGQHSLQQQQQQPHQLLQQYQSIRGGLGGMGPVKLEPQMLSDQNGPQQQLHSLRNFGPVKLEPQQNQIGRAMGPVKLEPQHSDQPMFLQKQQQQFLQMSRQPSQAVVAQMNLLQQQRILQMQQQQQQQLLKALPQQRPQLQQQFQQQNLPVRSTVRQVYEPGMCARRLTHYMYQQQHRPADNNIEFWRKFVAEFFAPSAMKRWCVSLYGNSRQTNGVFPQDVWNCEICNCKPGRGFETTVEVLPRLYKIKYDSGTLEELLYVDMPHEYQNASGQIVLDYAKAIQESVFEQLRVVRDGQLRIVFSPDLKICSWEFCARRHEELIPRRSIIPQVSQLGAAAQKYQAAAQNASSNLSTQEMQSNCNMFVASARQLAKALEVPLVNDLGYTKRYVRCLQISEVVNSMKDLIDYGRKTGKGPMESLAKFPRRTSPGPLPGLQNSNQQPEQQELITGQNIVNDNNSVQATSIQLSTGNGVASVNYSHGTTSTSTSATTIVGLLRQNSMNSRHETQMNNPNSPYAATAVPIPSAGSSTTLPPAQPNPSSPFSSSTPSSSNNPPQTPHNALTGAATTNHISSANSPAHIPLQQSSQSSDADPNDSQSSVEKIIQEIMNSSQFSGPGSMVSVGSVGDNMKNINGIAQISHNSFSGGNYLVGNGFVNNSSGLDRAVVGNLGGGIGLSSAANGIRAAIGSNPTTLSGRVGMMSQDASMNLQHQELNNRFLNGLGAINGFDNLQFDWKSTP